MLGVKQNGFTLIEAILVILLMGAIAVLVMIGIQIPMKAYHTNKSMLEIGAQYVQMRDFIHQELSQAWPFSLKIDQIQSEIRYQQVIMRTQAKVIGHSSGKKLLLSGMPHISWEGVKSVVVLDHPFDVIDVSVQDAATGHKSLLLASSINAEIGSEVSVLLLSGLNSLSQHNQDVLSLRYGQANKLNILVGHVTNTKFYWQKPYRALNINLSFKDTQNNEYTFVQQVFYDETL